MNDLGISLKANNTSGEQTLYLTEQDGDYCFTLWGKYNGEPIQIDFDLIDRTVLEEMRAQIDIILDC